MSEPRPTWQKVLLIIWYIVKWPLILFFAFVGAIFKVAFEQNPRNRKM